MNDEILSAAKLSLRISPDDTDFDSEITDLIDAAILDLGIAGVKNVEGDKLIKRAIMTYVKKEFGECENDVYARLTAAYNEQKAQLATSIEYRTGDSNG